MLLGLGDTILEKGDSSELTVGDGEVFRRSHALGELEAHPRSGRGFREIAPPEVKLGPPTLQPKAIPPFVPVVAAKNVLYLEKTGFRTVELGELDCGKSHVEPGVRLSLEKTRFAGDAHALLVHLESSLEVESLVVHPAHAIRKPPEPEQVVVLLGGAAPVLEGRHPFVKTSKVRLRESGVEVVDEEGQPLVVLDCHGFYTLAVREYALVLASKEPNLGQPHAGAHPDGVEPHGLGFAVGLLQQTMALVHPPVADALKPQKPPGVRR